MIDSDLRTEPLDLRLRYKHCRKTIVLASLKIMKTMLVNDPLVGVFRRCCNIWLTILGRSDSRTGIVTLKFVVDSPLHAYEGWT